MKLRTARLYAVAGLAARDPAVPAAPPPGQVSLPAG